jgi:hypothetical protein
MPPATKITRQTQMEPAKSGPKISADGGRRNDRRINAARRTLTMMYDFCRGVMAHPSAPKHVRDDPELQGGIPAPGALRQTYLFYRPIGYWSPRILKRRCVAPDLQFVPRQSAFEPQQRAMQCVAGIERALSTCSSGGSRFLIISL